MAENYTQVNSYQDKLLEAMSIVSSQLISSIPYDKTIICTIVDDTEKDKGKYSVTSGDTTFDAYSSDTKLKKDEVVYVTIPEGNYDNQKIIQGKKTSDTEKPFVFTTPLDTMLDLTGNLLEGPKDNKDIYKVKKEDGEGFNKGELIANNLYTTKSVINEETSQPEEVINAQTAQLIKLYERTGMREAGYSRLGIKAGFMSWIPEVVSGAYGLKITVKDILNTTTTDEQDVDTKVSEKTILLDASEMYGNPYNFETYYEQEKVVSVSELNTITDIIVEFYQIGGSFYNVENDILTLQDATVTELEDGTKRYSTSFGPNLFVDNIEIGLGYDINEVTEELIVPVIKDSMTYSAYRKEELNKKQIDLRWVHQFEDGPLVVEAKRDLLGENPRLPNCEIRWYRYQLGAAAADEYSGVYWTGMTVTNEGDKYILSPWDGKTKTVQIKDVFGVVEIDPDTKEPKTKEIPDYKESHALDNVIFTPDTSYQTEQIKAIIFLNGVAIRGPVITFNNEQSTTGTDVTNFINALDIECVDGTLGNYLIYNEAGNILNYSEAQTERKLSCTFAETGTIARSTLLLDSNKGDTIAWKFPIKNSMVSLQRCGKPNRETYNRITLTAEDFVSNTYYTYDATNKKYTLAIGEFINDTEYYAKTIVSDVIDLTKVWQLRQEYREEDYEGFEFIPCYRTNSKGEFVLDDNGKQILDYYECRKNGILYYTHKTLNYFEPYYEPWNIYTDINQNYVVLQNERVLDYNSNTGITTILYPTYKISALYSMYDMNNTIACTIRKDRIIYTSEREFTFGVAGTMGTDNSIVVDFVGGQTAVTVGDKSSYQLEVKMYDENNKPKDLSSVEVKWSWYTPGGGTVGTALSFSGNANTAVVDLVNDTTSDCIENKNNIYIAQVTVGEDELITYFPIPLKYSEEYSHIDGATSVIYLSNNQPDYYKGDYTLYTTNDDSFGSPDVQVLPIDDVKWKIISQESSSCPYIANVNENGKEGLKPIGIYTSGVRNYAIVAYYKDRPVWQQPILVLRNNYPSRIINKWDGKTLTIDEEMGTILSTAIAAGSKDNQNRFTGVMLGDWSEKVSDGSLQHTGVYGFHEGAMAYAFKDDGTGFIGKDAVGRIEFDGNEATISSANYVEGTRGMKIDFNGQKETTASGSVTYNNPYIKMYGGGGKIVLDTKATSDGYPFEIGNKFKAKWDGHIIANSGLIGGWILEEVTRTTDNTPTKGGRLQAGINGFSSGYWDMIELDPLMNTITGGRFNASVLESPSGEPIKLGGTIAVYDPSKLTHIENPHATSSDGTKQYQDAVNYDTGGYYYHGTRYTDNNGKGINASTKTGYQKALKGGTLGFMTMTGGSEVPKDFWPAGIGMKAENGGQVKATNQNVGMNIGSNYLFLSDYEELLSDGSKARTSEFQVSVYGNSTKVTYEEKTEEGKKIITPKYKTEMATSRLIFNGEGLSAVSGFGDLGARVILSPKSHSGIGYAESYLACYAMQTVVRGAYNLDLSVKDAQILLASSYNIDFGKAQTTINIGNRGSKTVSGSDGSTSTIAIGSTNTLEGVANIIKGNSTFTDILTVGSEYPLNTTYILNVQGSSCVSGGLNIQGEYGVNNGTSIVNYGLQVSKYAAFYGNAYISPNLTVSGSLNVASAGSTALNTDTTTTTIGSITTNIKGTTTKITSTTTEITSGTITFNSAATQSGIKAQFA